MIEVELRGLLTKQKYDSLSDYLRLNCSEFYADNKTAYFFKNSHGILKVVDEKSKDSQKISFKTGNEFSGNGMNEMDIMLHDKASLDTSVKMLQLLGYPLEATVEQKRMNYLYKGAEISLKFTESWSYHFEIEKIVAAKSDVGKAKQQLKAICQELDIIPMNEIELASFINSLRK